MLLENLVLFILNIYIQQATGGWTASIIFSMLTSAFSLIQDSIRTWHYVRSVRIAHKYLRRALVDSQKFASERTREVAPEWLGSYPFKLLPKSVVPPRPQQDLV